jgi:hypothetical protein
MSANGITIYDVWWVNAIVDEGEFFEDTVENLGFLEKIVEFLYFLFFSCLCGL